MPARTWSFGGETYAAGDIYKVLLSFLDSVWDESNNRVLTSASLVASDLQIGAVEIKDATSDNRLIITGSGEAQVAITSGSVAISGTPVVDLAADADIVEVTLSLDTSAYASGDVLAETQEVTSAFRTAGGKALLHSIKLNDKDDQGQGLDLVFLRSNVSLGTENAAPSITDANADEVMGIISISAGDFIDLGANRTATKTSVGLLLEAAASATSLWIAAISRGTGTYTASGITVQLGLLRY